MLTDQDVLLGVKVTRKKRLIGRVERNMIIGHLEGRLH